MEIGRVLMRVSRSGRHNMHYSEVSSERKNSAVPSGLELHLARRITIPEATTRLVSNDDPAR